MASPEMTWLPASTSWVGDLQEVKADPSFARLMALARKRLDFLQTVQLDRVLTRANSGITQADFPTPLRVAVLSSSTADHLLPGMRVGLLRRGFNAHIHVTDYGQYRQALLDPASDLADFAPEVVLFAFDPGHLVGPLDMASDRAAIVDDALNALQGLWRLARERFQCHVIQQTLLPIYPPLLGSNEHRLAGSPLQLIRTINERLPELADDGQVDLLTLDRYIVQDGIGAWHDPSLWHRAKQEISPGAGPMYGDYTARLIAAQRGRSAKCLVLDLDNTLWGGVIGDDGLAGIVLGQGSAVGEAFVSFQSYAKALSQRGVILAVCSKNDEANAIEAFEKHPDMVLRASDIAVFVANWTDKASNLREIAARLNIGIDALVFADDNPFERELIRAELPSVAVPELPTDPALYAQQIAAAGYFEGVTITSEDKARNQLYRANAERQSLKDSASDLNGYLSSLKMILFYKDFDHLGLPRIVQLINKTNQFNLTTRRYSEAEVEKVILDTSAFGLQLRLVDRLGDNGIIAVVIGRLAGSDLWIDTWLMSCRVIGRGVEDATLHLIVNAARERGATRLIGLFRATDKNGMVRNMYQKFGFSRMATEDDGEEVWQLAVDGHQPHTTFIDMQQG